MGATVGTTNYNAADLKAAVQLYVLCAMTFLIIVLNLDLLDLLPPRL